MKSLIDDLVPEGSPTSLKPFALFPAWNGPLTLAFMGFPDSLVRLKEKIEQTIPDLAPENPGSKWPKVTLGALNNSITSSQLETLRDICVTFNSRLADDPWRLQVDTLYYVRFLCRSLERCLLVHEMPLNGPRDDAPPSPEQINNVKYIVEAFTQGDIEEYIHHVATGHGTIRDFRKSHVEDTLVCPLGRVPKILREFKAAVDEQLPSLYAWMDEDSLHMTVRALVIKQPEPAVRSVVRAS